MGVLRWLGDILSHVMNAIVWGGIGILGLRAVVVLIKMLASIESEFLAFSVTGSNWPLLILLPAVFLAAYAVRARRGVDLLGQKFTYALLALVLLVAWSFYATAKPAAYGFLDAAVAVLIPLLLAWPVLAGRERKPKQDDGPASIVDPVDDTIVMGPDGTLSQRQPEDFPPSQWPPDDPTQRPPGAGS